MWLRKRASASSWSAAYSAEILCQETAHQKGPSYYGVWIMRVVSDEGVEKLLVTARTRTTYNDIKIREFKTISGVVSFFLGPWLYACRPAARGRHKPEPQAGPVGHGPFRQSRVRQGR